jgi:hypothetical protein
LKKLAVAFTTLILLLTSVEFAAPASARTDSTSIQNNCANLTTGLIRPTRSLICNPNELPIGIGPITAGVTRPKKMDSFLENRIKLAQEMGALEGYRLNITSGWRSLEYQQMLFDRAIVSNGSIEEASKWVLPPQFSNHPWGLAVDINYKQGKPEAAAWLEAIGYQFGLCRRYKNEWWHFEPLVAPGQVCPMLEDYPVVN